MHIVTSTRDTVLEGYADGLKSCGQSNLAGNFSQLAKGNRISAASEGAEKNITTNCENSTTGYIRTISLSWVGTECDPLVRNL